MKTSSIEDLTSRNNSLTIIDVSDDSSSDAFEEYDKPSYSRVSDVGKKKQQEIDDYELARSLQVEEFQAAFHEQFQVSTKREKVATISTFFSSSKKQEKDDDVVVVGEVPAATKKAKKRSKEEIMEEQRLTTLNKNYLDNVLSPQLEYLDPTPNIQVLFDLFNEAFFYGRLKSIDVKWSQKMTLCAGICRMKGIHISISLSAPLLTLRQRADTVNTLLHEMIHAYLFATRNFLDRSDHGEYFQKHMNRINRLAHSHITIFHNFHDEVDSCRKWWWQCDGPCRKKPPFFGMVKRSMNRPPQKADWWFEKHQRECGGTFHLVKSPNKTVDSLFKKK